MSRYDTETQERWYTDELAWFDEQKSYHGTRGILMHDSIFSVLMMWNDVKKRASFDEEKSYHGLVDAFCYGLVCKVVSLMLWFSVR